MIIKRWNSMSLILRICIGLVIGAILGLLVPGASWIAILGTLFVLAGFLGEMISRNSQERNKYNIKDTF